MAPQRGPYSRADPECWVLFREENHPTALRTVIDFSKAFDAFVQRRGSATRQLNLVLFNGCTRQIQMVPRVAGLSHKAIENQLTKNVRASILLTIISGPKDHFVYDIAMGFISASINFLQKVFAKVQLQLILIGTTIKQPRSHGGAQGGPAPPAKIQPDAAPCSETGKC